MKTLDIVLTLISINRFKKSEVPQFQKYKVFEWKSYKMVVTLKAIRILLSWTVGLKNINKHKKQSFNYESSIKAQIRMPFYLDFSYKEFYKFIY